MLESVVGFGYGKLPKLQEKLHSMHSMVQDESRRHALVVTVMGVGSAWCNTAVIVTLQFRHTARTACNARPEALVSVGTARCNIIKSKKGAQHAQHGAGQCSNT